MVFDALNITIALKAKIKAGLPAASRFTQPCRFFLGDGDTPTYCDHDFPTGSRYDFTPSGYLILLPRKFPESGIKNGSQSENLNSKFAGKDLPLEPGTSNMHERLP